MFENQSMQHHHQLLLKLLLKKQLEVEKEKKKNSREKYKFLFYNMGFIQYSNRKNTDQLNQQQNKIKNQDQYIQGIGYPIKKFGVHISDIKNDNKFGWTIQDEEFYFTFKFLMRDKKNYNPDISKQKKDQEKKEKQGTKELTWKFKVKVVEQIKLIKKIIDEVYPNYCNFIDKLNNLEIEIYDSESLKKELYNNKIKDKYLSYIFNELKSHSNNPNKIIVAAEIACQSLQNHFEKEEKYKLKKLEVIKSILDNLYNPHQNSSNIIRHIANRKFLNGQDIQLKDAPLFNALTQNFLFQIDLDVEKFLNGEGFYSCLNFNSLQELKKLEDDKKLINYENRSQIIQIINQKSKDKNQQLKKIKKYLFCLFGMKTHYYSKYLVELYKISQDSFYLKKAFISFKKDSPFIRDFQENTKFFYEELNNSQSQVSNLDIIQFSYMVSQQETGPYNQSDKTNQEESNIVKFSYMLDEVELKNRSQAHQQNQESILKLLQEDFKIYIEKCKMPVKDIKFFQSLRYKEQIDNIKILQVIADNQKNKKNKNIYCYFTDLIQKLIHQISDQRSEPDQDFQTELDQFWLISQHQQINQIIN